MSGFVEVRYDEDEKRVVAEPLELSQVCQLGHEFKVMSLGVPSL